MTIIPKRTMFLDGRRVVAGTVETVADAAGQLALKHGWAVLAEGDPATTKKAKAAK